MSKNGFAISVKQNFQSYRADSSVPTFPDNQPIIVFDGYCALCSGWARTVIRHDHKNKFRLLVAQSPLGRALYKHYGLDPNDHTSNMLLSEGYAWFKSEGTIRMFEGLGVPWSAMKIFRLLPLSIRDKAYDFIARNRYRIAGRNETCFMINHEIKDKFL